MKYKYIFQIKYTGAISSNSTRKLLWFEVTKMLIAVLQNKFIVYIIIFGTLSFSMRQEMMGFWDGSGISWTICKQSVPRS